MGLTFSRSVRFGAVRFNFSGSGIGVSTGIKGLRIGLPRPDAAPPGPNWAERVARVLSSSGVSSRSTTDTGMRVPSSAVAQRRSQR